MTFEEYLIKKRINSRAFAAAEPSRFATWQTMYAQMHPNSFYTSVKMVLNNVRLRYHLAEEDVPKPAAAAPKPAATRRATPQPAVASTSPIPPEVPAAPLVAQERPEEIPAAAKPRPVIRRPVIPKPDAAAPEEVADTPVQESTPLPDAEEVKPVVRARPVIKRPTALQQPAKEPPQQQALTPAPPGEAAAEAPKPLRPRPVIKRPVALQDPEATAPKPGTETIPLAEAPTENPAKDVAATPPRPRPVIKRPEPTAVQPEEEKKDAPEQPKSETPEAAKPPRPRPVMRRPPPRPDAAGDASGV